VRTVTNVLRNRRDLATYDPVPTNLTHCDRPPGVIWGYAEVVKLLAHLGAELDDQIGSIAACHGQADVARVLAKLGVSFDCPANQAEGPAHYAARGGHLEVLRVLAELGVNLNCPTIDGNTPVHYAAIDGHANTVRLLVELGALMELPNIKGGSGFQQKAPPCVAHPRPPLISHFAVHPPPTSSSIPQLLPLPCSLYPSHWSGMTPCFVAAKCRHPQVVRVLAELGADVNARDIKKSTPVFVAALNGDANMVRLLHELGADINTPDFFGATPCYMAASHGHTEVVTCLGELKANLNSTDDNGTSPCFLAAGLGYAKIIRVLGRFKADITTRPPPMGPGDPNPSILAFAACNGHFEATKALLLLGAPVTIEALKQHGDGDGHGNMRQFRADLQAWATDALAQHRTFHDTFLFGCLPQRAGSKVLETLVTPQLVDIAAYAGIVVGEELRRVRALGPALAAVDWAAHDEQLGFGEKQKGLAGCARNSDHVRTPTRPSRRRLTPVASSTNTTHLQLPRKQTACRLGPYGTPRCSRTSLSRTLETGR